MRDTRPLNAIRTIFIVNNSETYRLLEIHFKDDLVDHVEVLSACVNTGKRD